MAGHYMIMLVLVIGGLPLRSTNISEFPRYGERVSPNRNIGNIPIGNLQLCYRPVGIMPIGNLRLHYRPTQW